MESSSFPIPVVYRRKAVEATPLNFAEFGQVISAKPDDTEFSPYEDAQLQLHRGVPRFYIMHLQKRELNFHTITHHASVTQCLGSVGGDVWYLGVSRPSILNEDEITTASAQAKKVVRSKCQHYYVPPHPDDLRVFRISGSKFVKLHTGTWHAGPLFDVKAMDFYNLELSDTNVADHTVHDYRKENGVVFLIE
ncbi:Ureidoglycolate hydrolase [Zostera marina]|uniref:Ureidoglycolate hydrolase n=1 Tax=Zostera marina TaxID=29655 RepID=A0A0K9P0H4_ZOSMR|nr:Ureidoglycolate hydrolase [Zostera marina]